MILASSIWVWLHLFLFFMKKSKAKMYLVTILFKKKYFFFEKIEKNNILFHFKFLFIFFIVSDNFKIQNSPKQTWIKDLLYKFKTLIIQTQLEHRTTLTGLIPKTARLGPGSQIARTEPGPRSHSRGWDPELPTRDRNPKSPGQGRGLGPLK